MKRGPNAFTKGFDSDQPAQSAHSKRIAFIEASAPADVGRYFNAGALTLYKTTIFWTRPN